MEGLVRSTGTHAAGVVITAEPLSALVPLERSKGTSAIQTQYEDKSLEKLGLLKFDFLGLSNLTILDEALKLIKTSRGIDIDRARIPLDDQKTFDLLDYLPKPDPSPNFTTKTLDKLPALKSGQTPARSNPRAPVPAAAGPVAPPRRAAPAAAPPPPEPPPAALAAPAAPAPSAPASCPPPSAPPLADACTPDSPFLSRAFTSRVTRGDAPHADAMRANTARRAAMTKALRRV